MIQKKICTIGSFAVGKTSLVNRFVKSIFSEKYLTTVGVKIDKKVVNVFDQEIALILWDIHGEDEFQKIHMSYLRGTSGYLLVIDGTRRETLDKAFILQKRVEESIGKVPFYVVLNKNDLKEEWEVNKDSIDELKDNGWKIVETSAKTGEGVEDLFTNLTKDILLDE